MDHRKLALVFFFSCFLHNVHAEIYKWTDEKGQVHFGDKPSGENAKRVPYKARSRETAPKASTSNKQAATKKSASEMAEQLEKERKQREYERFDKQFTKEKNERARHCRDAHERLSQLQSEIRELQKQSRENGSLEAKQSLDQKFAAQHRAQQDADKYCR